MRIFCIIGFILCWIVSHVWFVKSVFSASNQRNSLTEQANRTSAEPSEEANKQNINSINGRMSETSLQSHVPFYFIGLLGYAILVDKSAQKLYLYDKDYRLIKTFHVTTGQNQGDKNKSGDRKTPEGVYFFTKVKEEKELLPEYGVMAIPINYPNFIDTISSKNGNGIWLHATNQPTRPLKPYDTRGCVVAVNEDILELAEHIKLQTTPMVIVDKMEYDTLENITNLRRDIEQFIYTWQANWENKDIDNYMAGYSKEFKANNMNWEKWKKYKDSINHQYKQIRVSLADIKILRHNNHVVVSFTQQYKNERMTSLGIKRLYLINENAKWKIFGEEWNPIPKQAPAEIAKRYASYRVAKAESLAEKDSGENRGSNGNAQNMNQDASRGMQVNFQKASFAVQDTPAEQSVVPDTELSAMSADSSRKSFIDIEDFIIDKKTTVNKVQFKLINKTKEQEQISGRVVILAANKDNNLISYISYPSMILNHDVPIDFRKGEWFSIRRFKIVSGDIGEKNVDHVTVLVYSKAGKLMLNKKFPFSERNIYEQAATIQ